MDANIQKVIDDIAKNTDLAQSALKANQLQGQQIADLQAQVSQLKAGQPLDADTVAALQKAATDLEATNSALANAVPQSTSATPAA